MTAASTEALRASIEALAGSHGLSLRSETLQLEEAGLDYRVAFATDTQGTEWVLRVPRRADVSDKIEPEARILAFLAPRVSVAIPDWKIHSPALVAYPRLPGTPGLTLEPGSGAPRFHLDPTSTVFAASLGRFVAELHRIDPDEAREAGVPVHSPEEVRSTWRAQLEDVAARFTLGKALEARWRAWLDHDALWPQHTVVTHGELYAAHVLVDAEFQARSVLDWTTAKVGDPAVDFTFQKMMAGPSFEVTVRAYEEAGGPVHPHLAERCDELLAASPILYGIYALTTGQPEHHEAAAAMLNPPA